MSSNVAAASRSASVSLGSDVGKADVIGLDGSATIARFGFGGGFSLDSNQGVRIVFLLPDMPLML